jgi:hypothetical protein
MIFMVLKRDTTQTGYQKKECKTKLELRKLSGFGLRVS